jgi:hypothetical protein
MFNAIIINAEDIGQVIQKVKSDPILSNVAVNPVDEIAQEYVVRAIFDLPSEEIFSQEVKAILPGLPIAAMHHQSSHFKIIYTQIDEIYSGKDWEIIKPVVEKFDEIARQYAINQTR